MFFSLGNIVIAVILIGCGASVIAKAYYLNNHFFHLSGIEQKWGAGAGTTAYRYIGLTLCILGMFTSIGIIDIYGTAFGGKKPPQSKVSTTGKPKVAPKNVYDGPKNGALAD
jgi:hypothetical protein